MALFERRTIALIAGVASLPFLAGFAADPDLWWHVRSGQRIWSERSLPAVDDWSFTAVGSAWTNHEWLADVVMGRAFDLAGSLGLLVLRDLVLVAAIVLLAVAFANRVRYPLVALVGVVAFAQVIGGFMVLRPRAFTFTLILAVVVVMDKVRLGEARWLLALPIIMVLWANLHGGFVLGLALIGVSLGALSFGLGGDKPPPPKMIVGTGLASVVATLANPHGVELYRYLVEELTADHSIISEWQPISGSNVGLFWLLLLVPIGLWLLAGRWREVTHLVMLVGSAVQAHRHVRFLVIMAIFSAIVVAESIGPLLDGLRSRSEASLATRQLLSRHREGWIIGFALTAAVVVFVASVFTTSVSVEVDPDRYPIAAVEWLETQSVGPNVASRLRWGGYLLWHRADDTKVAIDGRNLTVYEAEWVDSYLRALEGGTALDVVDEATVDAWLLDAESLQVAALVATGRWDVAYRDDVAVVVLPAPVAEVTVGSAPSAAVSFP